MTARSKGERRVTIYDVAERAGVAISTVSRVLNDSDEVAQATRERVLDVIRELEYRPDRTAKSLAEQQLPTIAVALPTFTTPFHTELLKGIRDGIEESEVDFLVCDLAWEDPHHSLTNFLQRGSVDGLILAGTPVDEERALDLRSLNAPVILIGHEWDDFDSFFWDELKGARLAVNHLTDRGHDRIAMLAPPVESPPRNARLDGYRQALQEAGLTYDEALISEGDTMKHAGFSEESGYEAMQKLLDRDVSFSAVFAGSDVQAIGAWKVLRDKGLAVPDDIALIGYDDIKTSYYIGLSTVAQHMHSVGGEAVELLLHRLGPDTKERQVRLIEPTLTHRQST